MVTAFYPGRERDSSANLLKVDKIPDWRNSELDAVREKYNDSISDPMTRPCMIDEFIRTEFSREMQFFVVWRIRKKKEINCLRGIVCTCIFEIKCIVESLQRRIKISLMRKAHYRLRNVINVTWHWVYVLRIETVNLEIFVFGERRIAYRK